MTHHTYSKTNASAHSSGASTSDWLGVVKKNPEGLLLLAAGCALLLRGSSSPVSNHTRRTSMGGYSGFEGQGGRTSGNEEGMLTRAADTTRQYAKDVKDGIADTAESYTSAVADYADETKRSVMDHSGRLATQVKSTVDDVLNYQPLAVAFVGLAAGAAVAAAFPTTRAEQQALGPTADRLSDAAVSATKKLSKAAAAAGDQLKTAADERGLNADVFKEMVSEVAGSFESSITGDQRNEKLPATNKEGVQDRMSSGGQDRMSGGGKGTASAQSLPRRPGFDSDRS